MALVSDGPRAAFCPQCGGRLLTRVTEGAERQVCSNCAGIYYPGLKVATAVVVTQHGSPHRVLMVKRAMPPYQGAWSLPAGFLDPDEDPAEGAAREVREETGLDCRIVRLIDCVRGEGLVDVLLIYSGRVSSGDAVASDDAAAVKWFEASALPSLAFPETVKAVRSRLAHSVLTR
jgi:8-oxo-dGTP diphosphatase